MGHANPQPDELDANRLALLTRWYRVRRYMAPVLLEGCRLALVQCTSDCWGTAHRISWVEFEWLVTDAEAQAGRRPPAKEDRYAAIAKTHPAGRAV